MKQYLKITNKKIEVLIVIILSTIISTAISHYTNIFSVPEDKLM